MSSLINVNYAASAPQQIRLVHFRFRHKSDASADKVSGKDALILSSELSCRIHYSVCSRLQVRLNQSKTSYQCCAFAWKRKRRQLRKSKRRHVVGSPPSAPIDMQLNCAHNGDSDYVVGLDEFVDDALLASSEREFCVQPLSLCNCSDYGSTSVERGRVAETNAASFRVCATEVSGNEATGAGTRVELVSVNNFGEDVNQMRSWYESTAEVDQTRLLGTTVPTAKNSSISETPTELLEFSNNNDLLATTAATTTSTTTTTDTTAASPTIAFNNVKSTPTTATARKTSKTPSPILGQNGRKINHSRGSAEKKSVLSKTQTVRRVLLQNKHQQHNSADVPAAALSAASTPTAEYLDAAELQQLKLLNRHSCNGRLDYASVERELQQAILHQQQQDKRVEALAVLLQYVTCDLDAFGCSRAKIDGAKTKENLKETLLLLDENRAKCTELQDQLCEKESYYTRREEELQMLHRCELEKVQKNLSDFQNLSKSQLLAKDEEHKRSLESYRLEMEHRLAQTREQLSAAEVRERELQERLQAYEKSEQELRDKISEAEKNYADHLNAAADRENVLNERLKELSRELESLREIKEQNERELRDKLNLSQDEIAVLRSSRRSGNVSLERGASPRNSATLTELSRLESEAESLRFVLELKQLEISKLTKQNEKLQRDAEQQAALQGKISMLESRNEMLQSELTIKSEKEKEIQRQLDELQKSFKFESAKSTRLSYDNEALQWTLKQRSEQLHLVEAKLHELSSQELMHTTSFSSLNRSSLGNSSYSAAIQLDAGSPPNSPIVKSVIEKNDSVSWVLEMDDETPEAAASKMVQRAGSFRAAERSPTQRRISNGATACSSQQAANEGTHNTGPNPLSQSMSASSVIREHSNEAIVGDYASRTHPRVRSKSVSIKDAQPAGSATVAKYSAKYSRPHSSSSARKNELLPTVWKEPISSSSPYNSGLRPRTSTMKGGSTEKRSSGSDELLFPCSSGASTYKLITCDTSALNMGEKLELRALSTHPSMHDMKMLKKCHEIQESAGEAMVSGTNSEDEASSEDLVSSNSTSSASMGSSASLHNIKNTHSSLEEMLLFDQINSLNCTPMEVSWSDDGEAYTTNSTMV